MRLFKREHSPPAAEEEFSVIAYSETTMEETNVRKRANSSLSIFRSKSHKAKTHSRTPSASSSVVSVKSDVSKSSEQKIEPFQESIIPPPCSSRCETKKRSQSYSHFPTVRQTIGRSASLSHKEDSSEVDRLASVILKSVRGGDVQWVV